MLLIVFGRAIQFLFALIIMRVMTTYLSPQEMGRMSLVVSAIAFFALFLVNPVGVFITRRLHAWEIHGSIKHYLNYYWLYLFAIALLASGLLDLMINFELINLEIDRFWLWLLVCGSLVFNTANQTLIPSLNLLGFSAWFMSLTLATQVFGFVFSIILIFNLVPSAENWLLGLLLAQMLFAVIGARVFFQKLEFHQDTAKKNLTIKHLDVLFGFAWPLSIAAAMSWVQIQGYRFFIEGSLGLGALGLFVVGYGVSAGLIAAFETILLTYFQPRFYKRMHSLKSNDFNEAWADYASAIMPALLLLICYITVMAPELARVLLGSGYQSSGHYIIWGTVAESFRVISSIYGMASHALMKTRIMMIANIAGALMSVFLLSLLTSTFGLIGVGASISFAGFFVILIMHLTISKKLKLVLPYTKLLQAGLMGIILVLSALALKLAISSNETIAFSFLSLFLVGLFMIAMQFSLLRRDNPNVFEIN